MNEGRIYVLKAWPEAGGFRADLRAVEEAEVLRLDVVQRLCEHIASLAGAPAEALHIAQHLTTRQLLAAGPAPIQT